MLGFKWTGKEVLLRKTCVITVLVSENPKKVGSAAHTKFAALRTGMPVEEYLALEGRLGGGAGWASGWPLVELLYSLRQGLIRLDLPSSEA